MARRYRRDRKGRFAGGGGGGGANLRSVAPKVGKYAKDQARSAGLRAAARGVTVTKTIGPVAVTANVSIRPANRERPAPPVTAGRIPGKRTGRRAARR